MQSPFTYNQKPVSLYKITEPIKLKPKILNLHTTILSIFLYDDSKIGIIVPNKKIHLINDNLEIIKSFDYSSSFHVFEESFQQNSNFLFVKQDHRLYICSKREPFSFSRTIIATVSFIAHSPDFSKTCVAYEDGSVCLYSFVQEANSFNGKKLNENHFNFVERIIQRESQVQNLFWLNENEICICFADGTLTVYSISQHIYYSKNFPEFCITSNSNINSPNIENNSSRKKFLSFFYSNNLRRLYFISNSFLMSISFSSLSSSFLITSDSIVDIVTSKILVNTKQFPSLFPIKAAIDFSSSNTNEKNQKTYETTKVEQKDSENFRENINDRENDESDENFVHKNEIKYKNGILILSQNKFCYNLNEVKGNFVYVTKLFNIFIAFLENDYNNFYIYDEELNFITLIPMTFKPSKFSFGYNKICCFNGRRLLIIHLSQNFINDENDLPITNVNGVETIVSSYCIDNSINQSIKHKPKDFNFTITTTTLVFRKTIKNSVVCWNNIFVQFQQNMVYKIINNSSLQEVSNEAISIWNQDNSALLFIQTNKGIEILFDQFKSHITQTALASSDNNLICLSINNDREIYSAQDFAFYILKKEFNNPNLISSFIKNISTLPSFGNTINKYFSYASQTGSIFNVESVIKLLDEKYKKQIIQELTKESQIYFAEISSSDLSPFFDYFCSKAKAMILFKAKPVTFNKIMRRPKQISIEKDDLNYLMEKILEDHQWSKAIRLSYYTRIDLPPFLSDSPIKSDKNSLQRIINELKTDFDEWKIASQNDKVLFNRYLGCSFIISGIEDWGIASFIASNDKEKIKAAIERMSISPKTIQKYINL